MERFIVIYRHGEYDEYTEEYLPFEYISKSELLLDLELSILYHVENRERVRKETLEIASERYEKNLTSELLNDINERCGKLQREIYIKIGEMIIDDYPYENISIHDFEVLTIDEFFDKYKPKTYEELRNDD